MSHETVDKTDVANSNASESSLDYEALAKADGWSPKESFRGDPEKWVDAKTFYDRGQQFTPFIRKHLKETQQELAEAKKQIEETKQAAKDFKKFITEASEREVELRVAEAKTKLAAAIEAGDGKAAVQASEDIAALKQAPKAEEKPEVKNQPSPDFVAWVAENDWYNKNDEMKVAADAFGHAINAKSGLIGPDLYKEVKKRMEKAYPDEFQAEERPGPQRGGKTNGANSKAKSFENLPDDAKKACDRMIKNGLFKDRSDYVKLYDWS